MEAKIITFKRIPEKLQTIRVSHDDYVKNIVAMNTYEVSICNNSVVTLSFPPKDMEDIIRCDRDMKAAIGEWTNSVYSRLADTPGELIGSADEINYYIGKAKKCIEEIKADPGSVDLHDLEKYLESMSKEAEDAAHKTSLVIKKVEEFKTSSLDAVNKNCQELVKRLKNDASVDQKKVDKLQEEIDELNKMITQEALTIAGVTAAEAFAVGLIVVAFAAGGLEVGIPVLIFAGIPALIGVAAIALDAVKIVEQKKRIDSLAGSMTLYEADISALQNSANNYNSFVQQAEGIQNNLSVIESAWQEVAGGLADMQKEIHEAGTEMDAAAWDDMLKTLDDVDAACTELKKEAEALDISNITVNNTTEVEIGMSSEEIKAAADRAENIPFLEYMEAM